MKCMIRVSLLVALLIGGVAGSAAFAASITYVDAKSGVAGNTALAGGGVFTPPLNGTTGLDNQWEERTALGNGANDFRIPGRRCGRRRKCSQAGHHHLRTHRWPTLQTIRVLLVSQRH